MEYCREQGIHFDINTAFEMYVDHVEALAGPVRYMYENFLMMPSNLPAWEALADPVVKFTAFGNRLIWTACLKRGASGRSRSICCAAASISSI